MSLRDASLSSSSNLVNYFLESVLVAIALLNEINAVVAYNTPETGM
jgi:hypothetical protein